MTRNGQDIHDTNPAEELNFLGYLNGTQSSNQGRNFGYPECYTAWDVGTIPDFSGVVGQQFAIGDLSATNNDSMCSEAERQAPRLGFHPHMAPLDILFNDAGNSSVDHFPRQLGQQSSCRVQAQCSRVRRRRALATEYEYDGRRGRFE